MTPTQAAAVAGVSQRTLTRRQADPVFRSRLAVAKAGRWSDAAAELRVEFRRSVATLVAIRDDERTHASTRVRAAVAITELALRVETVTDTNVEIAALTEAVAAFERGTDEE